MNSTQLSFFTPTVRVNSGLLNFVEKYTWFGGDVFKVGMNGDGQENLGWIQKEKTTWVATTLKIISMVLTLGLSVLTAMIIKAISRCRTTPIAVGTLVAPNPQIEKRLKYYQAFEEPLNSQLLECAQRNLPGSTMVHLVPKIVNSGMNLHQGANPDESLYLDTWSSKTMTELIERCPAVLRVLQEIKSDLLSARDEQLLRRSTHTSPSRQSRIAGIHDQPTPSRAIPLSQRPGGHVLGGN